MSIGLTDILAPLGAFPLLTDVDLKGGFRVVDDLTARDAIVASSRKNGMWVKTASDGKMWTLGPGLTNGDWSEVVFFNGLFSATVDTSTVTPTVIHTYTATTGPANYRSVISYDVNVLTIKDGGGIGCYKIMALFETNQTTITQRDVLYMNGPFEDNSGWDVTFNISGANIETLVTGQASDQRWRVTGQVTEVSRQY